MLQCHLLVAFVGVFILWHCVVAVWQSPVEAAMNVWSGDFQHWYCVCTTIPLPSLRNVMHRIMEL
jgi:hypothetical protein